jgi:hypothetical protein
MKRLYDKKWQLNKRGREADLVVKRRLCRLINDLIVKEGHDPHDVERIVKLSISYQITLWKLRRLLR